MQDSVSGKYTRPLAGFMFEHTGSDSSPSMIWLFERGREVLRLETRFDSASDEYVLVVVWSDNRIETERFADPAMFDFRLRTLEQELDSEQWVQVGAPTILSEGWKESNEG